MPESRSSPARTRLRGGLLGLLLLTLIGLAVASIVVFPAWLHPPLTEHELAGIRSPEARLAAQDARRQRQDAARGTLFQGVGALLVFTSAGFGAYFTWRQLHTAREGQVTERFTRAIDQLGADQLDIRLGGIYALERIARDSTADRPAIAEILTAYIRIHSPWPPSRPGQYKPEWPLDKQPDLHTRIPDVQAALTVIGRGNFTNRSSTPPSPSEEPLDLRAVDLRKANLGRSHLEWAMLSEAHLEGADLGGAWLDGTNLGGAWLEGANFFYGWLDPATLGERARAKLREARVEEANLGGALPERAVLLGARLQGADLRSARLERANLVAARLERANLAGARLEGANLFGAGLEGADLRGARLQGTNLVAAGLERANLVGAQASASTRWPDGYDWQAAGVLLVGASGTPVSKAATESNEAEAAVLAAADGGASTDAAPPPERSPTESSSSRQGAHDARSSMRATAPSTGQSIR